MFMTDFTFFENGNRIFTEFFVNEERRTVACVLTVANDVPRRLKKYGLADELYDNIGYDIREYKGLAKCAPEDEWDEDYGMRLAEYRAEKARQIDVNNELKHFMKNINRCIDNLYDYGLMKNPHKPDR